MTLKNWNTGAAITLEQNWDQEAKGYQQYIKENDNEEKEFSYTTVNVLQY